MNTNSWLLFQMLIIIDITKYCMNAASCNNTGSTCIVHTHYVTHDQVQCAINKIKLGKSDCIGGMISDNFKNGTIKLNIYIRGQASQWPGGSRLAKAVLWLARLASHNFV